MRAKVKAVVLSKERKQTEKVFFETVRTLNYEGGVNQKTERLIDVSREDMRVISHAPALEFQKTSEMILERVPPGSSLTPIPPLLRSTPTRDGSRTRTAVRPRDFKSVLEFQKRRFWPI
jgi:hypothetical protein